MVNKINALLFVLFAVFALRCKKNSQNIARLNIILKNYKLAMIDSNSTPVKLLKQYPIAGVKDLPDNCANLYVCKRLYGGELIFLLDTDKEAPNYETGPEVKDIVYSICKKDVVTKLPTNFTVCVPKDFLIPYGSIYIVARLNNDLD